MKNRERELDDLLAAQYHTDGLSYQLIAELMGCSVAEAGRSLRRAREAGRLVTKVVYPDSATENAVVDRMRDKDLEEKVRLRFGSAFLARPDSVWVSRCPQQTDKTLSADAVLKRTAALAGVRLLRHLAGRPDSSVGVSWGRVLESLVHSLEMKAQAPAESRDYWPGFPETVVFNTAGDFYGHDYRTAVATPAQRPLFSWSSDLAKRLGISLRSSHLPRLFYAPGWVPFASGETERELLHRQREVDRIFRQYHDYTEIHDRMIPKATVLLTGIGNLETTRALLRSTGRLRDSGALKRVVGDLSHHLLKEGGLDDSAFARLIDASSVGATAPQYLAVAAEARRAGSARLGVMAVCVGPLKREAVLAAVAADLLNVLVCDAGLARTLCSA